MMTIFLNASGANGFKKWSIAHPPNANDDDEPGGATPMAIAVPALDEEPIIAVPKQPDRPRLAWLTPRVGPSGANAVRPSGGLARIPHIRRATCVSPCRAV
jgi:hypothetical protein